MISFARTAFIVIGAMFWGSESPAQVFFVEPIEAGIFRSSDPTPTFLWQGKDSQAVLVMIPGGDGHLGLTAERTDLGGFYGSTLKRLSDPSLTSGSIDVVVFDSPYRLSPGSTYPTSRTTSDHLSRIESVIRYYKNKFNRPVWLMGHSNGAVSVTEFWRSIYDGDNKNLISGMIVSSSRNGISFPDETDIPVLFLGHRKDGCPKASPHVTKRVYESMLSLGRNRVEHVLIDGGEGQADNNCYSGYHVYFGANAEAADVIDKFIAKSFVQAGHNP
ncbi:MAG: hypothetical protein K2X44_01860 [Magnetospirillum sp.]|nr:hypothetical protein [Magnetospirillum sp.]